MKRSLKNTVILRATPATDMKIRLYGTGIIKLTPVFLLTYNAVTRCKLSDSKLQGKRYDDYKQRHRVSPASGKT